MDEKLIEQGMAELALLDADIAKAWQEYGSPPPRYLKSHFVSLLSIVVSQQISTQAAKAIMSRVVALMPTVTAEHYLTLSEESIRAAGLSSRKVLYTRGLAQAICDGQLNIDQLATLEDAQAIESIMALKGFGRWSAEIYLMFALTRTDVFPADDLALQVALGRLKGLDEKPTAKVARDLVRAWAPWRTVGSLFLWHYYRGAPA
ncbi:DNA-3-methyladenine glycosylase family protein [Photobacterium sanguinicancri]|uniref:DNA-3-methyladenine glycosylase II n=1 Tax=Photobacterium sanguinicancri TaxID=875932 RepID=A0AAW7Y0G2_9GAMM|nr:DNA-3-methyladenine glycosylase 2 family protein [Photobacterium sanguinicancri]MDO6542076.1 DNA-3-methyladenine glycosylase 2 family protein [Photobacterium sanguinicancri]